MTDVRDVQPLAGQSIVEPHIRPRRTRLGTREGRSGPTKPCIPHVASQGYQTIPHSMIRAAGRAVSRDLEFDTGESVLNVCISASGLHARGRVCTGGITSLAAPW